MIKVLFVIWSLERGGAERFLAGLLENINLNKFEPGLCCLNWKGEWAKNVENRGIKVIALNKKYGFDLKAFIKLFRIVKNGNFKIVNTHLWGADVQGRIAAFLCGVPIVVSTAQNVDIWKRWRHKVIDRLFSFKTNKLIAVSEAVKQYYSKEIGIAVNKIEVIPNAIDIKRYEGIKDSNYLYKELDIKNDDFVFACIGRLNFQKGHKYLFESVKALKDSYHNFKILVVGDGEKKSELIDLAKKYKISNFLRFTGQREDIPEILNFSNALVLPSLFEGLPLCVLEAMAAKKPIIATDVGGTKELAVDGKTAFIVPPKNSYALANAMQKLIELKDQGQEMGENGYEIVKNRFSIQVITKKTEELFRSLSNKIL